MEMHSDRFKANLRRLDRKISAMFKAQTYNERLEAYTDLLGAAGQMLEQEIEYAREKERGGGSAHSSSTTSAKE